MLRNLLSLLLIFVSFLVSYADMGASFDLAVSFQSNEAGFEQNHASELGYLALPSACSAEDCSDCLSRCCGQGPFIYGGGLGDNKPYSVSDTAPLTYRSNFYNQPFLESNRKPPKHS